MIRDIEWTGGVLGASLAPIPVAVGHDDSGGYGGAVNDPATMPVTGAGTAAAMRLPWLERALV